MFMCTRFWNEDFLKSLSSKGVFGSKLDEVVVFRKSFFEHFLNWNVIREKPKKNRKKNGKIYETTIFSKIGLILLLLFKEEYIVETRIFTILYCYSSIAITRRDFLTTFTLLT